MIAAKKIAAIIILLLPYTIAHSKIYKCTDQNGKTIFSEFPCSKNQKQKEMKISPQHLSQDQNYNNKIQEDGDSEPKQIMTRTQLMGKWTDYKDGDMSPFHSIWNFNGTDLIMHKYNGQKIKCKYTLKGNKLIMHHKNTALGSWDEEVEIKGYTGKTMSWDLVTLYRLQ